MTYEYSYTGEQCRNRQESKKKPLTNYEYYSTSSSSKSNTNPFTYYPDANIRVTCIFILIQPDLDAGTKADVRHAEARAAKKSTTHFFFFYGRTCMVLFFCSFYRYNRTNPSSHGHQQ